MVSKRFELLRELLVSETFKRSVFARLEKHRDLSQAAGSDSELVLADSAVANEHMDDVIRKHILEKVGWPPLITANEVKQQIVFQVAGTQEQDLDKSMLRLQAFLCQDVTLPTVSENDIDLGLWGWPEERLGEATIREELWLSGRK